MFYVILFVIAALVFLLCFLVDRLVKKLFPKDELQKGQRTVRLPRKSVIWGLALVLFPLVVLLFWLPPEGDLLLTIGCAVCILLGVLLLVQYASFGVWYDDEGFLCKTLRKGKRTYRYSDIRGQQSLLTRSGVQTTLFVGEDVVELTGSMQGLGDFLSKAFFRWCDAKGVDPDSIENNPQMFTFFPAPPEQK